MGQVNTSKQNKLIIALSIVIPIAVALLFKVRIPGVARLGFLPPIYATINAATAVLLVISVMQIKKGNKQLHERLIKVAMTFSVLFLLLYVVYHATSDATSYGGEGPLKYIYLFILATHIVLSIVVIPFVLFTYARATNADFERHKKLARITFPLWLYVAVTGVIVYVMISPYYPV